MERAQYDNSWKIYCDNENTLEYAQKNGVKKGKLIGKHEQIVENVKNGLENKLSLQVISCVAGVSVEEVRKIIIEQGWKEN